MDTKYLAEESLRFIKALTGELGPDTGLKAWDTIRSVVPEEVQHEMLMLSLASVPDVSTLTFTSAGKHNMIEVIKAIRTFAGYGLKEAKDAYDLAHSGGNAVIQLNSRDMKVALLKTLTSLGCQAR